MPAQNNVENAEPPQFAENDEGPSKTKRKNDAHALQLLGSALVELNSDQLSQVNLPESLLDAVIAAQKIRAHEGRRRQLQSIGKLMRNIDPTPIQARIDGWNNRSTEQVAYLHRIEQWRDRLLLEPQSLSELVQQYPVADIQQLRTLIRNTEREREQNKPPKNYRALFQMLRALIPNPMNETVSVPEDPSL